MAKQTMLAKKKRGPAPTGKGEQVVVRWQPDPLAALDAWVAKQKDKPTRAEAIRRLVEIGLTVRVRSNQSPLARIERAAAVAGKQLDQLADKSASVEEQASRKRRLLKGPEEFRNVRIDRPDKKEVGW